MKKISLFFLISLIFFQSLPNISATDEKNKEDVLKEELKKLKITEAGVYPIEISYSENEKKIAETINMFVPFETTSVFDELAIDAKNIVLPLNQYREFSKSEWILITQARAFMIKDGKNIDIDEVDFSAVKKIPGTYTVILKVLGKEKKITLTLIVDENFFTISKKSVNFQFEDFKIVILTTFILVIIILPLLLSLFLFRGIQKLINECYCLLEKKI